MSSRAMRTLLLAMAVMAGTPLSAATTSARLTVSVEVVGRTLLTIDRAPASVEVTTADAARGYVDLPQSVVFHVRSNAADGYRLVFAPLAAPFTRAQIRWDDAVALLGDDGVWIARPYQPGQSAGSLDVRLVLAAGTPPGTYAWPLEVSTR